MIHIITIDRLKELMTPIVSKAEPPISDHEFAMKKAIYLSRLNKIINILKCNYWDELPGLLKSAKPGDPILVLSRLSRARRVDDSVYSYLIQLYVILGMIQSLETRAECSISYDLPRHERHDFISAKK